jgi:hypothetical protein
MGIFGPHYPPPLQQAVNHAERFAEYVSNVEARQRPSDERAKAWLIGRAEELETVITCIVGDWQHARLSLEAAAHAISSYVRAMHEGAEAYLGIGTEFDYCSADVSVTAPITPYQQEAETVYVDPREPRTSDTLVDASALLGELAHKPNE